MSDPTIRFGTARDAAKARQALRKNTTTRRFKVNRAKSGSILSFPGGIARRDTAEAVVKAQNIPLVGGVLASKKISSGILKSSPKRIWREQNAVRTPLHDDPLHQQKISQIRAIIDGPLKKYCKKNTKIYGNNFRHYGTGIKYFIMPSKTTRAQNLARSLLVRYGFTNMDVIITDANSLVIPVRF
ncbi:hypothetical protein LCGC14_1318080 [marine sediment metagenome]|uniref:Uncharacterized protein n=1 Tax=marine sediment metagenome TaxID=412755 RepID=A0A0F9KKC5_9ZZZZ